MYMYIHSIHLLCGAPQPLPQRALHDVLEVPAAVGGVLHGRRGVLRAPGVRVLRGGRGGAREIEMD